MPPNTSRSAILVLYRNCLRSTRRIPDPEHRATYNAYIRDGFRSKQQLVQNSRQAIRAVQDAIEQLDQMNYYHSVREMKKGEEQKTRAYQPSESSSYSSTNEGMELKPQLPIRSQDEKKKIKIVQKWLSTAIPHLHADDTALYASQLVEDGFDSLGMLQNEILEEDLTFMKKAHRRALMRARNILKS